MDPEPKPLDETRMADASQIPGEPVRGDGDAPGQLGPYRILKRLGGGGMGQIYLAVQAGVGREVALKVLPPGFVEGSEAYERFEREVHLLGQLSHPNICAVLEAGHDGDTRYYAMEYLRGLDVAKTLRTQRMDPARAAVIAVQALRALQFAHDRGVVHRDVKPHNIMLVRGAKHREDSAASASSIKVSLMRRWFGGSGAAERGGKAAESSVADPHLPSPEWEDRAYLIDFGLARDTSSSTADRLTMTGAVVGTPAYMSPEQARGDAKNVGAASDVYSLGAVLFEMLTLRAPFEGDTVAKIIHDVVNADPPALRAVNPLLDRDIETIVARALEKDPGRRYPTAAAFADDLERWLAGEPILARRASLAYRLKKRIARNPLAAAALAVAAGLAAVGLWSLLAPGTLEVRTMPEGAEVKIDGKVVGMTPYRGRWIPGRKGVQLELADFEVERDLPIVESGRVTTLERTLRHETGTITLTSEPSEIGLELRRADGRVVKMAAPAVEQPVETGVWTVTASAKNHFPRTFTLEILCHTNTRRHVTLNPVTQWTQRVGGPNQSAMAADLDGDGRFELVGAWYSPQRVIALDGAEGTVLWQTDVLPLLPEGNIRVDAADLDGDMEEEVVLVDGGERLLVLDGRTGRVRSTVQLPGARSAWIHEDVTGDGLPDIVVFGGDSARILDGATLAEAWRRHFEERLMWACEARFRKGEPRGVVVGVSGKRLEALDGKTGATRWTSAIVPAGAFWAADFDLDGAEDVSGASASGKLYSVSGADGAVFFESPIDGLEPVAEETLADVDGDGRPDIVRKCSEDSKVIDGRTGAVVRTIPVTPSWGQAAAIDLDGDGRLDLVYPTIDRILAIDPRTGREFWRVQTDAPVYRHPVAADFDGDGRSDIAICSWSGAVSLLSASDPPVAWKQEAGGWVSNGMTPIGDPPDSLITAGNWLRRLDVRDGGIVDEAPGAHSSYARLWNIGGKEWFTAEVGGLACIFDPHSLERLGGVPGESYSALEAFDLDGDGTPEFIGKSARNGGTPLIAWDARTWKERWVAAVSRNDRAKIAFCGGRVWTSDGTRLTGLDPATGATTTDTPLDGNLGCIRSAGRSLFLNTSVGTLKRFEVPDSGPPKQAWSVSLGHVPASDSPWLLGDALCFASSDGHVALLDAADGRVRWRVDLAESLNSEVALRDLDGDGAPEVAVPLHSGWVRVLDGRTGRTRWSFRPGGEFGPMIPAWADVDGDGAPELLVTTQRPFGYALKVQLDAPRPAFWPSYRTRSASRASEAAEAEASRQAVLAEERAGNNAGVMAEAKRAPTAFACARAAFAAEKQGDPAAARDFAARASALGARSVDLDWLAARLGGAAEFEGMVASLGRARLAAVAALRPAPADDALWKRACAAAATRFASDVPRAVLLLALSGDAAAARALAASAPDGPAPLALARAALRDDRFEDALPALERALRSDASAADARDLLESLRYRSEQARADGAATTDPRAAAERFAFAARILTGRSDLLRQAAASLLAAPSRTPEELKSALDFARRAVAIASEPVERALALDTLAAALFAGGDKPGAIAAQHEALAAQLPADVAAGMRERLAAYEK